MFGRGKKKSAESPQASTIVDTMPSQLRELCGGDEEMYSTLSRLMFLDPKKLSAPLEVILTEAQDSEAKGNSIRAEVSYRIAGSISLWKGDAEGVRKYFEKASKIAGESRPEYRAITKRADQAVGIARKYYETSEPTS